MKITRMLISLLFINSIIFSLWGNINTTSVAVQGIRIGSIQETGGGGEGSSIVITVANLEETANGVNQQAPNVSGGYNYDNEDAPYMEESYPINTQLIEGNNYPLPATYPKMFLSYSYGSTSGSIEITSFRYIGQHSSGEHLYTYTFGLGVFLPTSGGTGYYSLTTADGELYPVHDYGAPNELFSCNIFSMTCRRCRTDCTRVSVHPYWLIHGVTSFIGNTDIQLATNEAKDLIVEQAKVSPNPVDTDFSLEILLEESSIITIDIIDINGKVIERFSANVEKGNYKKRFITSNWQKGIYFLHVKINDKYQTHQIVKSQ